MTANSDALIQCRTRSPRSNRSSDSGDRLIASAIALPDPRVDVVALLLPIPGYNLVADFDAVEPLARLVAVHRRDVQANRPAVLGRDRPVLHRIGDDHVGTARLVEREALGVLPVERVKQHRLGARLHPGLVEQGGESTPAPADLCHPPPPTPL